MEGEDLTPGDLEEIRAFIDAERTTQGPFDVLKGGMTADADDREQPDAYSAAGVTWWLESLVPWGNSLEAVRQRIESGPPR